MQNYNQKLVINKSQNISSFISLYLHLLRELLKITTNTYFCERTQNEYIVYKCLEYLSTSCEKMCFVNLKMPRDIKIVKLIK